MAMVDLHVTFLKFQFNFGSNFLSIQDLNVYYLEHVRLKGTGAPCLQSYFRTQPLLSRRLWEHKCSIFCLIGNTWQMS